MNRILVAILTGVLTTVVFYLTKKKKDDQGYHDPEQDKADKEELDDFMDHLSGKKNGGYTIRMSKEDHEEAKKELPSSLKKGVDLHK